MGNMSQVSEKMNVVLSDVVYPASKDEIVKMAQDEGLTEQEIEVLNKLPEQTYDDKNAVVEQVSQMMV
jgi:small nuclear ribonucleoprotein (snRNP)-like protein